MQGVVHLLAGAAIALAIQTPSVMFVTAFFSHYILDLLPHIDPDTFATPDRPYTGRQWAALIIDILLVIGFMAALYVLQEQRPIILLGAIAALLPDLLAPLERYAQFAPLKICHEQFHWNPRRANLWSWYIAGLVTPAAIGIASLTIILAA